MLLMTSDGIDRLGFLIHDAQRLLRKRFEMRGAEYGLSAAQWRLLVRVVKDEGVPQARLAELLEIEPISVSRLLDRMEAGGWISRQPDASDRRVRMIFPTDKSRSAFVAIKSVAGEVYEEALAGPHRRAAARADRRPRAGSSKTFPTAKRRPRNKRKSKEQCHERSGQGRSGGRRSSAGQLPVAPAPALVPQPAKPVRRRRPLRLLLMVSLPLAMAVGGGYFWVTGGRYQETENANVRQSKVSIASDTSGRIVEVERRRQPAGQGRRRAVPRSIPSLTASRWRRPTRRLPRRGSASSSCAPPTARRSRRSAWRADEVDYLQDAVRPADRTRQQGHQHASPRSTRPRTTSPRRRTSNWRPSRASPARAPRSAAIPTSRPTSIRSVLAALATRDNAAWNLAQTTVRAPADGVISQSTAFKVGQYVTAGTPLFSLVENGDTWVEANFKETQLTRMKVGQEAEIVLDTYPSHPFKAVVDSIGAGTGSEFSLLPAQNATGNWVKVTQRIPVRLKVEDAGAALALRTGMSADVSIDTGASRGFVAACSARPSAARIAPGSLSGGYRE